MRKNRIILYTLVLLCINASSQSFKQRIDALIENSGGCEYVSLSDPSDSNSLFFHSLTWSELYFVMIEREINVDFPYTHIVKENESNLCVLRCEDYPIVKKMYATWWHKKRRFSKNKILKKTQPGEALLGSHYKWR